MKTRLSIVRFALLGVLAATLFTPPSNATPSPEPTFITLGTNAGPLPNPYRSEPANALQYEGQTILIDVGDGADQRLAEAGIPLSSVRAVVISHLHFDHTGGLFAFLGQRYQTITPGAVTIYGPPGIRKVVDGLVAAMKQSIAGAAGPAPEQSINVVEIDNGGSFKVGGVRVTAASNSHYSATPQPLGGARQISLSYRFDMPGRSIVYTGDTGPSRNVEKLADGADLLVSEIIDPAAAMIALKSVNPDLPPESLAAIEQHFRKEHLSPDEAGEMAKRAGVTALVLTHIGLPNSSIASAQTAIASKYNGVVTFARDLDRF